MLKKILSFLLQAIVGVLLLYLIVTLILIPLLGPWIIRSQAAKFFKKPVQLRAVQINPFLGRITLKDFSIRDEQNNILIGFDRFGVDISFLNLPQKIYRLEEVTFDGLKIHATLLAGNRINLLELVPPSNAPSTSAAGPASKQEMPVVIFDRIALHHGQVIFIDQTVNPNFQSTIRDMELNVTGFSTKPDSRVTVDFGAKLNDQGDLSSHTTVEPFVEPLRLETSLHLNQYVLTVLTPYAGKYAGRELAKGRLDFKMDYRIADHQLTASHKVLIQDFTFGQKVPSPDALNLPFGLAVALLEDSRGKINISLPVKGDMSDPQFEYWPLVGQVARNFFMKLITKPFSFLASMVGSESGTDELGSVIFAPGEDQLKESEKEKLRLLTKALEERPLLILKIPGAYDPAPDWQAVKTQMLEKDLQKVREESTRGEAWVYQEVYEQRFGIREQWRFVKQFRSKDGKVDEMRLIKETRERLIHDAPPKIEHLNDLGQRRAQVVRDYLLSLGFPEDKIQMVPSQAVQSNSSGTPLEFSLTVFEEKKESE